MKKQHKGIASPFNIFLNLSNTIIGAGTLTIPYSFSQSGILLGCFLLFSVSILSIITLIMLIQSSEMIVDYYKRKESTMISENENKGSTDNLLEADQMNEVDDLINHSNDGEKEVNYFSYKQVVIHSFSIFFTKYKQYSYLVGNLIDIFIFLLCFGVLISYTVIVGDYLSSFMENIFNFDKNSILCSKGLNCFFVMIFIMFPLSCLKKITFLSYTSFISIICIFYCLIVIVIKFFIKIPALDKRRDLEWTIVPDSDKLIGIFIAFPVFLFSFGSHMTVLPMYSEMKNRNQRVMSKVIYFTTAFCLMSYLFIGIFGYLQFGDANIKDNILNAFRMNDISIVLAKIGIFIVVSVSFPLVHYAARENLEHLYESLMNSLQKRIKLSELENEQSKLKTMLYNYITTHNNNHLPNWLSLLLTVFTCSASLAIAILLPNLAFVFSFTGATMGTIVMFVTPCLVYGMVVESKWKRIFAFSLATFNLLLGCISTVALVIERI
ncbi:hypothetical protein ABK040_009312 [Willaertia magna]